MSGQFTVARPSRFGALASGLLLAVYVAALTLVSGWKFTVSQFSEFWIYIVPLAAGFGIQVALYVRLRQVIRRARSSGTVLAASGTTSTAAMISCCAHYLTNVAPVLGATGVVAFAAQFQVELPALYALIMVELVVFAPGYIDQVWNLAHLSGGLYEHVSWRTVGARASLGFGSHWRSHG